jgi:glutamate dehydrogenase
VSSISLETGAEPSDIARAYEVVNEVFDLSNLWRETSILGIEVPASIKVEIFSDLAKIMRRGISWFVKNIKSPIHITETVEEYRKQTELLVDIISKLLVGTNKTRYYNKIEHYVAASIDKKLAKAIATLEVLVSAFDIIYIAKKTKLSNEVIANLYFECGDLAGIDWLRDSCESQINESYWNRLSIQSLKDDLYDKQRRLVVAIALGNKKNSSLKSWIKMNMSHAGIFIDFINQMKMQEAINLNMIILANKKLEIFLRKVEAAL